jgi:hypothetical protein
MLYIQYIVVNHQGTDFNVLKNKKNVLKKYDLMP